MRHLITTTALAAGLALSAATLAGPAPAGSASDCGPPPGHEHGPHHGLPLLHELHELKLSDAQKAQIHGFLSALREQAQGEHRALKDLRHRTALAAPGSSDFRALTAQLADAEANAARERVQQLAELRTQVDGVLTPAQRQQLATAIANRPEPPAPLEPR